MLDGLASHDNLLAQLVLASALPAASARVARCSRGLRRAVYESRDLWVAHCRVRWGVVPPPTAEPRLFFAWLQTEVRAALAHNVGHAFRLLADSGARTLEVDGSCADWHWEGCARQLLRWLPLIDRRRLAAYVCADRHPVGTLRRFLGRFDLAGTPTPEAALRALLLEFPFLPIDAGDGADRVISELSYKWVRECREALPAIGLPEDSDEKVARDTVYTWVYSIIMLNTDLHNPAVQPKITAAEYAASCARCGPLRHVPTELFEACHVSLSTSPLVLAVTPHTIDTTVRSTPEGEVVAPATYSRYSTIRRSAPVHANGAVDWARVDWRVAYWNGVDAVRHLRRAARRLVTDGSRRPALAYSALAAAALGMAGAAALAANARIQES